MNVVDSCGWRQRRRNRLVTQDAVRLLGDTPLSRGQVAVIRSGHGLMLDDAGVYRFVVESMPTRGVFERLGMCGD